MVLRCGRNGLASINGDLEGLNACYEHRGDDKHGQEEDGCAEEKNNI